MASCLQHVIGFDLTLNSTGDLAVVAGDEAIRERVIRRLMTVRSTYIWQPTYGGGLPTFVGSVANAKLIQTVVRSQMLLEAAVARQPLPTVSVSSAVNGVTTATITYASQVTGYVQQLAVKLEGS